MSARTDALVSRAETGKIVSRVHLPRCGRLSPVGAAVNARPRAEVLRSPFSVRNRTSLASRPTHSHLRRCTAQGRNYGRNYGQDYDKDDQDYGQESNPTADSIGPNRESDVPWAWNVFARICISPRQMEEKQHAKPCYCCRGSGIFSCCIDRARPGLAWRTWRRRRNSCRRIGRWRCRRRGRRTVLRSRLLWSRLLRSRSLCLLRWWPVLWTSLLSPAPLPASPSLAVTKRPGLPGFFLRQRGSMGNEWNGRCILDPCDRAKEVEIRPVFISAVQKNTTAKNGTCFPPCALPIDTGGAKRCWLNAICRY